jgi:guanyl-specific ribonuclease Sa
MCYITQAIGHAHDDREMDPGSLARAAIAGCRWRLWLFFSTTPDSRSVARKSRPRSPHPHAQSVLLPDIPSDANKIVLVLTEGPFPFSPEGTLF